MKQSLLCLPVVRAHDLPSHQSLAGSLLQYSPMVRTNALPLLPRTADEAGTQFFFVLVRCF